MLDLPDTNVAARALDVVDALQSLSTCRIESSGTSLEDFPGLVRGRNRGRRTAIEALL
jgi:hypothetical protein